MQTIRVWAPQGEPPVQYYDADGRRVRGRFVARGRDGQPLPEGEVVAQTAELVRDLRRGHLTTTPPEGAKAQE
jgi:hypothetical protein